MIDPMDQRNLTFRIIAVTAALMMFPSTAQADIGKTIVWRCTHAQSISGYTVRQYEQALQAMGTDTEEYTECGKLIQNAMAAAAEGRRSASSSVPVTRALSVTPSEQRSLDLVAHQRPGPISVGEQPVTPGVVHVDLAKALNRLPTPMIVNLAFVVVCVLWVLGVKARRLLNTRRSR